MDPHLLSPMYSTLNQAPYYTVSTAWFKHVCVLVPGSGNREYHEHPCPWSANSHGRGTWCLRSRDTRSLYGLATLPLHCLPIPGAWEPRSRTGPQNAAAPSARRTISCQPIAPRDPDRLSPMYSAHYQPLLHCLDCRVKHVCVPVHGSVNQGCHGAPCPQSTKSHGRGTWCLRSSGLCMHLLPCHPHCLPLPGSLEPRSRTGPRNAAAPSKNRPVASPLVRSPMYSAHYTVSTVGLYTSAFLPLEPGTESTMRVHVHGPPSPTVTGPGVLEPGSYELATLPPPLSRYPRVLRTKVSCAVYGMPQPRRPEEPPSCQPLAPRHPDLLSPMYPTRYRPHVTLFGLSG